jgi:hypothetical protein
MGARRKITILLHERDAYPDAKGYFIWALCDLWRREGVEIEVLKGPGKVVVADLLIPHIDLTVLPEAYVDVFNSYPRVVNRHVRDISKRLISRNLVTRTDSYDGPVIVKTNLNYGGIPEARLIETPLAPPGKKTWWDRFRRHKRKRSPDQDWASIRSLKPSDYPIFPSLKEVPEAICANEALVIERFLPEFENGFYHLRIYQFFGGRGYCVRLGSREAVVKMKSVVSREELAVPDEIVALRRDLGLDYGKMDFVIRDGRVVLLDVNRTPGLIAPSKRMQASALRLAPGLNEFF